MAERNEAGEVLAAGGALWRRADDGTIEVLIVHRPRYDDWSLPKGKAEPGESALETAVREVQEETGLAVAIGPELATVRYHDHLGRPKVVRYWAMAVTAGSFVANDEVDEVRWLAPAEAAALLTQPLDVEVLRTLGEVLHAT